MLNLGAGPEETQASAEQLSAYEKEMADHPLEALTIARRASSVLGKDEKQLYQSAAEQQEKNLALLGLGQIIELAEVLQKKLDDPQSSRRVRVSWLEQRGMGLTPEQVRQLLGPPQQVTSEILYRRQIDQWVYNQPTALWINFSYTNGHMARVRSVHSTLIAP